MPPQKVLQKICDWAAPKDATKRAVKSFQADHGLPATGELDDATRDAINHAYLGF